MKSVKPGAIVWAATTDPRGYNRKYRPLVVLSLNEDAGHNVVVRAVAITGKYVAPNTGVPLRWDPQRHNRTGLYKESWANCDWIAEIPLADIVEVIGEINKPELLEISDRLSQLDR